MKTKFLSFVLVLTFVLAACSPAATPTAAPPATEAPAPLVPFPTGRFEGNGVAVQYNADGTFEFYTSVSAIDPIFIGTYTVDGNLITATNPDETDPKCQDAIPYQWFYTNGKLTFWPTADDPCKGRREANAETYVHNPRYIPEIKVIAKDYDYIAPKSIRSGWVRVTLVNNGTEPHHVQFLRLNDGVTAAQFEEALKQGEGPALALTKQYGGVGAVAPGMSATVALDLPAGEYVILCLIPSPSDGVAHHDKGMIKTMTVRAEDGHGNEPSADMTVRLQDFTFEMVDVLPAGPFSIQVVNGGPEAHEFNILKLEDGKTAADVMAFLGGQVAGPPPFIPVGGANGIDVGATEYAELNLEPGNYVAICNIPSPKAEGHPHFTLGMIRPFTVGEAASSNFPVGKFIKVGTTNYGLTFNADGTFYVFEGDNIFVHGTYSADGNTFTETSNDGGCDTNMAFAYTFDGTNLTFNYAGNPADDATCSGRYTDFNNVTYTLLN